MKPTHCFAMCCFLILIFAAFSLQLTRERKRGHLPFKGSYSEWRSYVLYLWVWVIITGIGIVVTGALALEGFFE